MREASEGEVSLPTHLAQGGSLDVRQGRGSSSPSSDTVQAVIRSSELDLGAHRRALAAVRVHEELPVVVDALELEAGFAEDLLRRVLAIETKIQGLLSDYLGILREAVLLFDHEVLIQLLRDGDPLGV